MSTPSKLFNLANHNKIIYEFLQIWQNGDIEFEGALFGMHEYLLKNCFHFKKIANLSIDLEEYCDLRLPTDDGFKTLTFASLKDTRSIEIKRQEHLIEKIIILANLMKILQDEAVNRISKSPCTLFVDKGNAPS